MLAPTHKLLHLTLVCQGVQYYGMVSAFEFKRLYFLYYSYRANVNSEYLTITHLCELTLSFQAWSQLIATNVVPGTVAFIWRFITLAEYI